MLLIYTKKKTKNLVYKSSNNDDLEKNIKSKKKFVFIQILSIYW